MVVNDLLDLALLSIEQSKMLGISKNSLISIQ